MNRNLTSPGGVVSRDPLDHLDRLGIPALSFLAVYLRARVEHARAEDTSRGASAVEWVVISAIVVTIVGVAAAFIGNALHDKSNDVGNCIRNTSGNGTC
jgi:hypothetical protein